MSFLAALERYLLGRAARLMTTQVNREAIAADRLLIAAGYRYAVRQFGVVVDGTGGSYIVDRDNPRGTVLHRFYGNEAAALRLCIQLNYYWHVVGHRPPLTKEF